MKRARNSRRVVSSVPSVSLVGARVSHNELGLPFVSRMSSGEAHARFGEAVDTADLQYAAPQSAGVWMVEEMAPAQLPKPSFMASVRAWFGRTFGFLRT